MIIVDTSVWIDYLAGTLDLQTDWLDRELNRQRLGLIDLILCEVLQGVKSDLAAAMVLRQLSSLAVFNSGGEELAVASAQNYRTL